MTDLATRFSQLSEIVDSTPDAELDAALAALPGGLDSALDTVLGQMASLVNPAKVKDEKGVFQYEVTSAEGVKQLFLKVEAGTATVGRGLSSEADITIGVKLVDLVHLATGRLSGQRAFVTGKLKLKGNALFGLKLGQWFDRT